MDLLGGFWFNLRVRRQAKMDEETFIREETISFDGIDDAFLHISDNEKVNLDELTPLKGRKIF